MPKEKISEAPQEEIPVGVSSCLLGENVRYDGGHKRNDYVVQTLGRIFDLQPFCPEMAVGMGVPRPKIHLLATDSGMRAVGIRDSSLDVTDALHTCTENTKIWHSTLCGYILKRGSPSCGMEGVKMYRSEGGKTEYIVREGNAERNSAGLYAARLMKSFPAMPVEEEGRLDNVNLRENFIRRVYLMHRWQQMVAEGLSVKALCDFHGHHKPMLTNHGQKESRALGRLAAQNDKSLEGAAQEYILRAMVLLKT